MTDNETVTVTLTREQYDWMKASADDNIKRYYEILDEDGEEAVKHFCNIVRVCKDILELQPNP